MNNDDEDNDDDDNDNDDGRRSMGILCISSPVSLRLR